MSFLLGKIEIDDISFVFIPLQERERNVVHIMVVVYSLGGWMEGGWWVVGVFSFTHTCSTFYMISAIQM